MDQRCHHKSSANLAGFRLPADVSLTKQAVPHGWAYLFRHQSLGVLGRMVLQETADGRTHISCEVAGDAQDPMTAKRMAILQPLSLKITQLMEGSASELPDTGSLLPPEPLPPEPTEVVESKLISCERCGVNLAMLVFAPGATDAGRFEDYARRMYSEYKRLNVQTWIIGPALGVGPLMDRPADLLKIWPIREPIYRQAPAQFNAMLDRLTSEHCR
jgi:hypothetical protein